MRIRKGDTPRIVFYMSDATDNETAETGVNATMTISKNGGTFAATTNNETEIANGWYYVDLTATETNTAGTIIFKATGTGANDWLEVHEVYDDVLLDVEIERAADIILRRNLGTVAASSDGDTLAVLSMFGMALLTMNVTVAGSTITVKKPDDTTLGTIAITTDGSGNLTGKDV